ncbi:MurR/RpiR family transcriptional regulator [Enterococcus raffinosus]|uniref:MurR/RpiR family transcriptional regulator n=1 Tax=Enterococcus raffinosus TaxID=71452 RepID=UPI001C118360|nr:MurR/RpiR family transcriptional regulator [Enterococcus raffinosus]MBU5361508.1 MurR/RpiR family transcriptional regulator [Enterococcus raffinosus]
MTETKNFYTAANQNISHLNESEKRIFQYVLKNFDEAKHYSIRQLAKKCFVSSATIFRFTKKLGFEGYSDFVDSLLNTPEAPQTIPHSVKQKDYREEYLKNVLESIRVADRERMETFNQLLDHNPIIYLIGEELDLQALHYIDWLFTAQGFHSILLSDRAAIRHAIHNIKDEDILFVFDYTGDSPAIIETIELVKQSSQATIVSFTRAVTNIVQNLCDIDFYIFTDEIIYDSLDMTSRISMIAIVELILYKRLKRPFTNE